MSDNKDYDAPSLSNVSVKDLTNNGAQTVSADILSHKSEAKTDLVTSGVAQLETDRAEFMTVKNLEDTKNYTIAKNEVFDDCFDAFDGFVSGVNMKLKDKRDPSGQVEAKYLLPIIPLKTAVLVSKQDDSISNIEDFVTVLKKDENYKHVEALGFDGFVTTMDDDSKNFVEKAKAKREAMTAKSGKVKKAKAKVCKDISSIYHGLVGAYNLRLEKSFTVSFNKVLADYSAKQKTSETVRAKSNAKTTTTTTKKTSK